MLDRLQFLFGGLTALFQTDSKPAKLSLEEKLPVLAKGGLQFAAGFGAKDLLASLDREVYEAPGWEAVLGGLGGTQEQPPWRHLSQNLWHFDTECIEGSGSYVAIAERMRDMAQGSLPISNIKDFVDERIGKAWLEFKFQGPRRHIVCKVNDDWVDERVFRHFVDLLAIAAPAKLYLYYDLKGQDCILACVTKAQFAELQRAGIAFEPLS